MDAEVRVKEDGACKFYEQESSRRGMSYHARRTTQDARPTTHDPGRTTQDARPTTRLPSPISQSPNQI